MIRIAYLREKHKIKALPQEVQKIILGILQVLESEYGKERKLEDDGGYVMIVDKKEEFEKIKDIIYINCEEIIPEFVDKILCGNGEIYTNSLILCNNDYAISLIIPIELTPENLKDYMIN